VEEVNEVGEVKTEEAEAKAEEEIKKQKKKD
jgi:hypothetical protein